MRVILPATTIPTTHPRRSLWLKIPLVVLGSFSRYGSEFPLLWLKNPPAVGTWPKAGAAFPILPRGAAETFAARLAPHVGGGPMAGQALGRFALQRLGQDTQDTQDTQDGTREVRSVEDWRAAHPFAHQALGTKHQALGTKKIHFPPLRAVRGFAILAASADGPGSRKERDDLVLLVG